MAEMVRQPKDVFLERRSYRRRRLIDAVRVMPVVAVVLFFMPVLWAGQGGTSSGLIYVFAVWGGLIVLMAVLAQPLVTAFKRPEAEETDDKGDT